MKKNKFLRIASALLMLCLITTCAVSGTFAKYTTSDSDSDTARVAKWGVTVAVDGTLFGKYYGSNTALLDADKNRIVASSTNVASAADGDGKNVVAPGTKNDTGFQVQLKGKPEVAYELAATNNGQTIEDIWLNEGSYGIMVPVYGANAATDVSEFYTLSGTTYTKATSSTYVAGTDYYELQNFVEVEEHTKYYPITWNIAVNVTDNKDGGSVLASTMTTPSDTSLMGWTAALIDALNTKSFTANSEVDITYKLTWEWKIQNTNPNANSLDTILGTIAAGGNVVKSSGTNTFTSELTNEDYNLDVVFGFALVATQVD